MEEQNRLPHGDAEATEEDSGHLYKDVGLEQLNKERDAVRAWVQLVDSMLLTSNNKHKRNQSHMDSQSFKSLPKHVTPLPKWAKENAFVGEPLRKSYLQRSSL